MTTMIQERVDKLKTIQLLNGSHKSVEDGLCAMEAAAWIAGEPHTDHPQCSCPVITAFMISWNDAISNTDERTRVIGPLVPLTVGTRSTKEVEQKRAFMCTDWMIRTWTPEWLDMCSDKYAKHTAVLRSLPEITDWQGIINATPILVDLKKQAAAARDAAWTAARDAAWTSARDAARTAAWTAARAAAWAAAWDAAWTAARAAAMAAAMAAARDAAWAAAWAAARAAAWTAARDAARAAARAAAMAAAMAAARAAARDAARAAAMAAAWAAARAAARTAAMAAARTAARDAAREKLTPIKDRLQVSAADLVKRMCEIK